MSGEPVAYMVTIKRYRHSGNTELPLKVFETRSAAVEYLLECRAVEKQDLTLDDITAPLLRVVPLGSEAATAAFEAEWRGIPW